MAQDNNTRTVKIDSTSFKKMTLKSTKGWEALYNKDHTPKDGKGYSYPNVSRDRLSFSKGAYDSGFRSLGGLVEGAANLFGFSSDVASGLGDMASDILGSEPYIIRKIGERHVGLTSRSIPIERAAIDAIRIGKFFASRAGLLFIAKQNLLGQTSKVVYRSPKGEMIRGRQRFKEYYQPLSTIGSVGARLMGTQSNPMMDREGLLLGKAKPGMEVDTDEWNDRTKGDLKYSDDESISFKDSKISDSLLHSSFNYGTQEPQDTGDNKNRDNGLKTFFNDLLNYAKSSLGHGYAVLREESYGGDKMTMTPIDTTSLRDRALPQYGSEGEKDGMPFYFKDLRDNSYVVFRGNIEGLSENLSPSWLTENFIGRSEPVYIYERCERDISFSLKLFAQTKQELVMIYRKLNRLTSMCYPEYKKDDEMVRRFGGKVRMKPPLVKFRLGELFGKDSHELMGFIKSLTYTYPENSPWETEKGKRVPKHIIAAITYQVIHTETPGVEIGSTGLTTFLPQQGFYGFTEK